MRSRNCCCWWIGMLMMTEGSSGTKGSENREMGDSTSSSRRIYLWFEGWGGIWMGCIVKGRESAYNSSKTGEAITLILLPFCYCPLFGFSSLQVAPCICWVDVVEGPESKSPPSLLFSFRRKGVPRWGCWKVRCGRGNDWLRI